MVATAIKENSDIVISNSVLQYSDGGRAYLNLSEASLKNLENEKISNCYAPSEIFCCSYAPYFWEAIQIRYPEYTKVFENNIKFNKEHKEDESEDVCEIE